MPRLRFGARPVGTTLKPGSPNPTPAPGHPAAAPPPALPPGSGFSVVIHAWNDDRDLPLCLASIAGCDDVVVLDAGSTDATVELARAAGARVFDRALDTLTGQWNYAQRNIPFRHPWVFHLEACERMTPELRLEAAGAVAVGDVDAFLVAPKVVWDSRWIRHSTRFPQPEPRLVRAPDYNFDVRTRSNPRTGCLGTGLWRDPSRGGGDEWLIRQRRLGEPGIPGDAAARGPWLFLRRYILAGGFRDGLAGWHYCRLLSQLARFAREKTPALPRSPS